jgi:hypothetical protein
MRAYAESAIVCEPGLGPVFAWGGRDWGSFDASALAGERWIQRRGLDFLAGPSRERALEELEVFEITE